MNPHTCGNQIATYVTDITNYYVFSYLQTVVLRPPKEYFLWSFRKPFSLNNHLKSSSNTFTFVTFSRPFRKGEVYMSERDFSLLFSGNKDWLFFFF